MTNVNVTNVTNVYNRTVVVNNRRNVSFNGGSGGITARPTRREEEFGREPHRAALAEQSQHEHAASQNRQLFASENHGRPAIAATGRAGEFNGRDVQRARAAGEAYRAPKISPREARAQSQNNSGGNRGFNQSARNQPARSGGNREQMSHSSSRDNSNHGARPERQPQRQDKAAPARTEKSNRAPAKGEPKGNGREHR